MTRTSISIQLLLLLAAAASPAEAQSVLFRVRTGGVTQLVQPGGRVTIPAAAITAALDFQIGVVYQGSGNASLTRYELAGAADFRTISAPDVPIALRTDQEVGWNIRFQPRSSANAEAQFAVTVRESFPDGTFLSQTIAIISLVGTAPEIGAAQTTSDGNLVRLNSGDVLTFPATAPGSVSSIPMIVFNRGSGPGRLESVTLDSPNFQLVQLPILPDAINPSGEIRFAIRYAPRSLGTHSGILRIRSTNAEVVTTLSGVATETSSNSSTLRYYRFEGANKIPVQPGDTIPFPEAPVTQRSVVKFRIENSGLTESSALFATADGTGFSLAEGSVQVIIPATSGIDLTLVFQSDQAGVAEGRLLVGGVTFVLRGTGLGPSLRYRYDSGAGPQTITQGSRIFLGATPLGIPQKTTITLENAGNQPAIVPGIQLANGQASVRLENVPDMPLTLNAGESATFTIDFTPIAVNSFADVLLIGQSSFDVSGPGLKPPKLPDYELTSTLSTVGPAQQGSISLRLTEPYPLRLSGTVRLRINPNGVGLDPAAQFAVSGRSVSFKIPANTTDAVFDDEGPSAHFQTGTVTSTLVFVPTFTTLADTDVTPENPKSLSLFLAPSIPTLLNARIIDLTTSGFSVSVNGISSTKSLVAMEMSLTSSSGGIAQRTIDLKSFSQIWFGTALSDPYGGFFSVTVPFSAPFGSGKVQSVTMTVRNELGQSNSVTVITP